MYLVCIHIYIYCIVLHITNTHLVHIYIYSISHRWMFVLSKLCLTTCTASSWAICCALTLIYLGHVSPTIFWPARPHPQSLLFPASRSSILIPIHISGATCHPSPQSTDGTRASDGWVMSWRALSTSNSIARILLSHPQDLALHQECSGGDAPNKS